MTAPGNRAELAVVVLDVRRKALVGPLEEDERLGTIDRQRPEDGGVDQGEDGGVCAETDGEGEHDGQRQCRRPTQLTQSEARVLPCRVEPFDDADGACVLGDTRRVSQAETALPAIVTAGAVHLEMEPQFFLDLGTVPIAAERVLET